MKKVSITLPTAEWGSVKSKYSADSLFLTANDFSSGSINIDTMQNGNLMKRFGGTNYNPSLMTSSAKDQFEAIFSDGTHHLMAVEGGRLNISSGDTTFSNISSGYSASANFEFAMALDRVYFGNGITNQVYDRTASYGGVGYAVPRTRTMGCQVAGSACTAALVVDSTTNQVPAGAHTYKVTFLYYGFEESNGNAASNSVTADGTHTQVSLTSIPVGSYGVTARKIYRDNADGNYVLLGTIADNTTTTYTDRAPSGGAVIPTDNGVPPVFGLICSFLDRLFFAKVSGSPYNIYYTAPGLPDIVYGTNFFPCNQGDPVQAIIVYLGRIIVLNRNSVGQILGTTSDTFRYQNIQTNVGCTDNRSVQIRTINGVPTLIWLSDKGFYTYNGSSVNYISEPIEDLVNLNIQQSLTSSGSNSQTTQAQFQGGTASNGIDLLSAPGLITTKNPKRVWQLQSDWDGGTTLTNVVTKDGTNLLKVPLKNTFSVNSGTLQGLIVSSSKLFVPTSTDWTGEASFQTQGYILNTNNSGPTKYAVPFIPARSGTVTSIYCDVTTAHGTSTTSTVRIETDNAGVPSGTLAAAGATGTVTSAGNSGGGAGSSTMSGTLTGGVKYWIVIAPPAGQRYGYAWGASNMLTGGQSLRFSDPPGNNIWAAASKQDSYNTFDPGQPSGTMNLACGYNFSVTPIAGSGLWTSDPFDSGSASTTTTMTIAQTVNGLGSGTSVTTVEGSNSSSFNTAEDASPVTQSVNNIGGATSLSISGKRYWRVKTQLNTPNNVSTPNAGNPTLTFATTSTWVSEVIDCTSDVTTYNSLTPVVTTPTGTTATVTVATSADNVSYTSFVAFGSATVQRYIKVQVVLTAKTDDSVTSSVTSITLKWTIVANLISSAIDTGVTPSGWDIFQAAVTTNGGTLAFYMRSATTSGGLTGGFTAVTIGNFPTVSPNEWVQWKVIITSTADSVPTVDSVTINWFIGVANSIRVASIFYNRNYYLAAAEFSQSTNNLVLELDGKGQWRVLRGLKMATLGLFFNKPYYCSALSGQFVNFLSGLTDSGTAIEWDARTKAFDFSSQYDADAGDAIKILRDVVITGVGTGATLTPYFSVDNGTTWLSLTGSDGLSSFTTSSSGRFVMRLQPNFADGNVVSGRTIIIRLYNNDAFGVEIHKIKMDAYIRQGEVYT